jgi:ADP-ribose pyrophosphatase YjhB (NUDIX family)
VSNRTKTEDVVVLLVHDGDDHVVIVRDLQSQQPHKWEFPGGRLFEGESHKDAAVRIMQRELNVYISHDAVGRPVAEVPRGGRMVTSLRVNLPDGPAGNLCRFTADKRHEVMLIEKRELSGYMPRKSDRDLMQIGYRG